MEVCGSQGFCKAVRRGGRAAGAFRVFGRQKEGEMGKALDVIKKPEEAGSGREPFQDRETTGRKDGKGL